MKTICTDENINDIEAALKILEKEQQKLNRYPSLVKFGLLSLSVFMFWLFTPLIVGGKFSFIAAVFLIIISLSILIFYFWISYKINNQILKEDSISYLNPYLDIVFYPQAEKNSLSRNNLKNTIKNIKINRNIYYSQFIN